MMRRFSQLLSVILTMAVIMTGFAFVQPVNAEEIPDMEKVNVMWDLQNDTPLKYKQRWHTLGVKQHTVKMTNYEVTDADAPGYKQCSFTLTFNMKVNPTKKQVKKMGIYGAKGNLITDWGYCIVDYQTGYSLGEEAENDKDVTESAEWHNSKFQKIKGLNGTWIRYPRKSSVDITLIYPKDYKDLCIGAVGFSSLNMKSAKAHWKGKLPFSEATSLYSKKDPMFAHFMRVE